jgi:ATP-binding cassette subfamily B protein
VLDGFSLRLAAGEQAAIVGASGGGTSTLATLLIRFHEPQRGAILLDGRDLRSYELSDLRRAICVVEQTPFLFSGPLIDALRYGARDAARADIDRAIWLAGLEGVVSALTRGVETTLAEAGRQLSGGERQRIALARAIVRDPAVLVLDEATSALDGETEDEMLDRLAPWLSQRTVIAIAHRFSTARRFPRAIMLRRGVVACDGPPDALAQRDAAFADLFAEQLPRDAPRGRLDAPRPPGVLAAAAHAAAASGERR